MTFTDDLSLGLQNWTLQGTACDGVWHLEQNRLTFNAITKGGKPKGFISTRGQFLTPTRLQFRFYIPAVPCETDLWLRSFNYTSVCRIALLADGHSVAQYARLNGLTNSGMFPMHTAALPAGLLRKGDVNLFCEEICGHRFTLYLNGQAVLQHTDETYPTDAPAYVHLKTTAHGAQFFDFSAEAKEVLYEAQKAEASTTEYLHTVAMDVTRSTPFGFTQAPARSAWRMQKINGNPAYGTYATPTYTQTWLHGFAKNSVVTANVICRAVLPNARCGLLGRFAVEGSYLRAGYDFGKQAWFIAACLGKPYKTQEFWSTATPPTLPDHPLQLQLQMLGATATLTVNGTPVVTAEHLGNVSFGRIGLFAQGTDFYATEFACTLPQDAKITDGILEQTVAPDQMHSHFEIERLDQNTLYGQYTGYAYISHDCGLHWSPAATDILPDDFGDVYPCIHKRLSDGKYIRLLCNKDFLLQESADFKNWIDLCHILPQNRLYDEAGRTLALIHLSSFTELPMPNGSTRLFLPIAFRMFDYESKPIGHQTCVFYSDDGGKNWQESKKNIADLDRFTPWSGNMSWCESKVIRCADGRLRMLCTRTIAPCIYYADSFDHGETWSEYGELPQLPTPTTSYAICPDPAYPNSYLMVYVNNPPHFRSTIFPRTRLTLVRTDGLTFTPLTDIERFSNAEDPLESIAEVYQILDPCICAFQDYIFISFGRSEDVGGHPSHNNQRIRFVRIDRAAAGI